MRFKSVRFRTLAVRLQYTINPFNISAFEIQKRHE